MKTHSRARGWALQALYAWEMRGAEPDELLRVLHDLSEDLNVSPQNRLYADVLIRLVARHLKEIDALVQRHLTNWRLARLSVIDRNILRLGAAEMKYVGEISPRATIREMMQLAEKYSSPESPKFINGVLDAIMREVAPNPGPAGA